MSLARIYHTKKSRKVWTCSKCQRQIPVGSPVLSFAVGFRGWEQRRCGDNPACYPAPSERESSLVSAVYAAQEGVDLDSCQSLEDIENVLEEVASACDEVADEYEGNEMYDVNYDLQERAETVRSAGEELRSWTFDGEDEPEETDERFQDEKCEACDGHGTTENDEANCDECGGTGYLGDREVFEDVHDEWLNEVRSAAQEAIDNMELP